MPNAAGENAWKAHAILTTRVLLVKLSKGRRTAHVGSHASLDSACDKSFVVTGRGGLSWTGGSLNQGTRMKTREERQVTCLWRARG